MNYTKSKYKSDHACHRTRCMYHAKEHSMNTCDYCIITGELRGCDVDKDCTKYKRYIENSEVNR